MTRMCRSAWIAVCLVLSAAGVARAQLVDQPVRIVFPFPAGGGGDGIARLMADKLSAGINRPVIVENRTGAGGRIGMSAVKGATPDGSMLLFTPIAPMSIYPLMFKSLNYDPVADFEPVTQISTYDFAIAIHPEVPAKSLNELVEWLKANPAKANFGVPAMGTLPHFLGLMFGRAGAAELRPIAFRGAAASIADAVAGHIPMVVSGTTDLASLHHDGRLRALVTSSKVRSRYIPDVPTFRELGYDLVANGWYAIYAPARTPRNVVELYNRIIVAAIQTSEVENRLRFFGQEPTGTTPAELAAIQKADRELWEPVIKLSGFTPE